METVTVNISFRKGLLEEIDKTARQEARSRSELIREAARAYIEEKREKEWERKNHMDVSYDRFEEITGVVAENAMNYNGETEKRYTYADYLKWPDDEKWELIDGVPYSMAPAPSSYHQSICMALSGEFYSYLKNKPCKVFAGPLDVRLPEEGKVRDDEIRNVVQPDILIVCNRQKIDIRGCLGAPDLVVEIISPNTSQKDSIKKLNTYERMGVREYWIIRPKEKTLMILKLGNDKRYGRPEVYAHTDTVRVGIFEGLKIDLRDIFQE